MYILVEMNSKTPLFEEKQVNLSVPFHGLLGVGAAFESTTDPVLLAYIMRREGGIPTASALFNIRPAPDTEDPGADERAYARAYDLVVDDLSRPPLPSSEPTSGLTSGNSNLSANNVGSVTFKINSSYGTYNTPVTVAAGRICKDEKKNPPQKATDFYAVSSGSNWVGAAKWQSASFLKNQIKLTDDNRDLTIDWQDSQEYCTGGIAVDKNPFGGGLDSRICRYVNYPQNYQIQFLPMDLTCGTFPELYSCSTLVLAAPSADQGKSSTYSSTFDFKVGSSVNVSGNGPAIGVQESASWSESVSDTVPAMLVEAGDKRTDEGTFTIYKYCAESEEKATPINCTSTISMASGSNVCQDYIVGQPQWGQTPDGRLSNTLQAAAWHVNPDGYEGLKTYDITVNWDVELATSTAKLWGGPIDPTGIDSGVGPTGSCNSFGCSCSVGSETTKTLAKSVTFKVSVPSSCSTSPPTPGSECSPAFCAKNPSTGCTSAPPSCLYCDRSECHEQAERNEV